MVRAVGSLLFSQRPGRRFDVVVCARGGVESRFVCGGVNVPLPAVARLSWPFGAHLMVSFAECVIAWREARRFGDDGGRSCGIELLGGRVGASLLEECGMDRGRDGEGAAGRRLAWPSLAEAWEDGVSGREPLLVGREASKARRAALICHAVFQEATRRIRNGDRFSVGSLARLAGCSSRTLDRILDRCVGMSPMRFLRALRLNEACRRLLDPSRAGFSVTDVLMGCGFDHVGRASGYFRQLFGVSPSVMRRRAARR